MAEILARIAAGEGTETDLDRLLELAATVRDGSLCGLGQTAPNPVLSTLRYFRDEYRAHIIDKSCPACVCKKPYHVFRRAGQMHRLSPLLQGLPGPGHRRGAQEGPRHRPGRLHQVRRLLQHLPNQGPGRVQIHGRKGTRAGRPGGGPGPAMNIIINGRAIVVSGRPTVLEAARANGFAIPSLCDHRALLPYGACRICLVEIKGRPGYAPSCSTFVEEGIEVVTESPALAALRRGVLELILAEHPNACLICTEKTSCDEFKSTIRKTGEVTGCVHCPVNGRCDLQRVVDMVGVERVPYPARRREGEVLRADPFIDRDNSLCILCGRCVRVCGEVRGGRGPDLHRPRLGDGGRHGPRPDHARLGLPVLRRLRRRLPDRVSRRTGGPARAPAR